MLSALIALVKMLAAHLLADFIFQSDKMCRKKFSTKLCDKYASLTVHALIQAALTYLFLAQWGNWIIPAIIGFSHFFIDWIKSTAKDRALKAFIVDQFCHFLVIFSLWWVYYIFFNHPVEVATFIFSFKAWVIFSAFIVILSPTSLLIKLFMEYEKWTPNSDDYKGLPNAGKWIGYLERILILIFIFTGNIEGVGFLLAAKSIFRFGELNKTNDLKLTEYVLIGTFASFTVAISTAYIAIYVINMISE